MHKIDRLGWTDGIAFTAYGTSVGIRTNDPTMIERLLAARPPGWDRADAPVVDLLFSLRVGPRSTRKGSRNYHLLYLGALQLVRTLDLQEIFDVLENHLKILIASRAQDDRLFVHAGVVGWQNQAIVIPGRSMSGKTTLVMELLKAGATYYSDDMAIFDPHGWVHPFPQPLSVRASEGRRKYAPEAFGRRVGIAPLPVGLILMTQYDRHAVWQPRPLPPSRALMALLDNTVAARKAPWVSLPILKRVATRAAAIQTRRGEAETAAQAVLAELGQIANEHHIRETMP
ncbi:MAG: hypothetical protein ETSY1_33235 [Candidatus Entotheonella factor]|uniref:HPr kinase n=1 Tax=Entotheonella factor TaxID=1429438 RepID=W4L9Z8_ENTF1|nr:hypothetical protein [Candidatus Entotheonella palauensis]ETW94817.1 MAG: hypothetical protein ETSY1_33235 [Candidatus Entotheonella factor]